MTRLALIVVFSLFLTGCLATLPSSSNTEDYATFKTGLSHLEKNGDTSVLKKLSADKAGSAWGEYSDSVLKIYSAQDKKIKSLQKKNKKLQDDLNKLNQINLELEKRAN